MKNETTTIAISEFKATCLRVLKQVKRTGTSVMVTKRGAPVAMVVPPPPPEVASSWLGMFSKSAKIVGDVISPVVGESEWETLADK